MQKMQFKQNFASTTKSLTQKHYCFSISEHTFHILDCACSPQTFIMHSNTKRTESTMTYYTTHPMFIKVESCPYYLDIFLFAPHFIILHIKNLQICM